MQIHELEEQLGLMLVERTRAGVLLSDKGREVAARAARILSDVREMVEFAQHGKDILSGSLRLGVIPSIAPYMLPPLLPLLRESYADLELHVRETQTLPLVQELVEGKLDVLLLALPIVHSEIETLSLFDDRFVLALPIARRMSSRVRATKDLIEHERLLLLEEGHCLRDQALTYCNLQQVSTVNTFGVSSLSTIVEMVAAGYGITLLPEMCLNVEARAREIGLTRFVDPEPHRTVGLAWRATSPRVADFRELGRLIKVAWSKGCVPPGRKNPRHKRPLTAQSS
jgi:LysR family hydrogen peroxide-inducible transcriptional activator